MFQQGGQEPWNLLLDLPTHSSELHLLGRRHMDVPRQADLSKQSDDVPSHVKLPPLEAVAGREAKGVVVAVPLAKGDHRDPPMGNKGTHKW